MKPTVLLYNFTDSKRKMKVQQALMPLGFRLRAVKKEEYGLPVGVLAGVKGLNEDVLREAGQAIEAGEETQKEGTAQKQADGRLQREVPENDSSRKDGDHGRLFFRPDRCIYLCTPKKGSRTD